MRRIWVGLVSVLFVAACATTRLPETQVPEDALPSVKVEFPADLSQAEREPDDSWIVTISNCAVPNAHQEAYTATLDLPITYTLPAEVSLSSAEKLQLEGALRQALDVVPGDSAHWVDVLSLSVPGNHRGTFTLGWDKIWLIGELTQMQGGQAVSRWPLRVLASAELVQRDAQIEACASDEEVTALLLASINPSLPVKPSPATAYPAPTVVEARAVPTTTPIPTPEPTACPVLDTGQDAAQQVVAQYLDLLNQADYEAAYDMLSEAYQARVPFQDYRTAYEPVRELRICAAETTTPNPAIRVVEAQLQIDIERAGREVLETWQARYELQIRAEAEGGYEIIHVSMHRVP